MSTGHKKNQFVNQSHRAPLASGLDPVALESAVSNADVHFNRRLDPRIGLGADSMERQALDNLRDTYEALDLALNTMAEQEQTAGNQRSSAQHIQRYSSDSTWIPEDSFDAKDFEQRRRSSTGFAEINPKSISLVEQLDAVEIKTNNRKGIDGQIQRASQNKANQLPPRAASDSTIEDEQILENAFWATVREGEQWHIKEFYPGGSAGAPSDGSCAEARLSALRDVVCTVKDKSVFLLHGEFATGRSFYGRQEGKGIGLAWSLARAGYHVFVVDMVHRRVKFSEHERGGIRSRIKRSFERTNDSEIITGCLPAALSACADKTIARLNEEVANQLAQCSSLLNEQQASPEQRENCIQLIDEIQLARSSLDEEMHSPGVWMGHGFSSALLSACWARLPEEKRSATRMVFFGARRRWRSGSTYSRLLSKLLCSTATKLMVTLLGRFPSRFLQLGSADQPAELFELFSQWSKEDSWLDPADQFDYREMLQKVRTPTTLHVMNEFEDALVAASDVRRFANEVCPESANLIGIPSSLPQSAEQLANTVPRFSHSGMLVSESAEKWIFSPVIHWLEDSALASTPLFDQATVEISHNIQMTEGERNASVNLDGLIPLSSYS